MGPRLRLIASFGTGVDHIDANAAREKGITVTNTPGVLSEDTADAMALILAYVELSREIQKSALVNGTAGHQGCGHRINGKRLGIIGMGSIGQAIARRAKAFGMSIHYHNRKVASLNRGRVGGHSLENVEQSFSCGYYFGKCPSTPATHHFKCA